MVYSRVIRNIFERKPQQVIFFITSMCNYRCKMCFYWKNIEKRNDMSLQEIQKIAKKMSFVPYISLTGGEPFLREDLPEIVEAFKDKAEFIHIPSNGSLPDVIEKNFRKILKSCPKILFKLSLSLDGIGKDHDEIRGVDGAFENFLESYKRISELKKEFKNFELNVITTFSKYNQDKIKNICDFVHTLDIDGHNMTLTRGNPREICSIDTAINKYEQSLKYFTEKKNIKNVKIRLLHSMKYLTREIVLKTAKEKRLILPCVAGDKLVVISEDGKVYPCELLSMELGNLRKSEYDLEKVLNSSRARMVRKYIRDTKCFCTFECAIQNNILSSIKMWYKIVIGAIKM